MKLLNSNHYIHQLLSPTEVLPILPASIAEIHVSVRR